MVIIKKPLAVIHEFGQTPRYEDFPDPVPAEGETLVRVQASVLENFDKVTALGTHYSSKHLYPAFPAIVGRDGIGLTEDGRLVGFGGLKPPFGSFAEKTVVGRIIPLPEGIDPAEALTKEGPYDVVIDFLWGHPAEVLLNTFIPNFAGFPRRQIRYVQIGDKAGSHISIPAPVLRTSGVAMMGMGVISNEVLATEMEFVWKGIQEKRFFMEIERIPLADIARAWERTDLDGKRLVIIP